MENKRQHLPCDACGSSDALTDYVTHTHCYSCGQHRFKDSEEYTISGNLIPLSELGIQPIASRGISLDTTRKFSYGVANGVQVATYWNTSGDVMCYQKTRDKDKNFRLLKTDDGDVPPVSELLFGRRVWGSHGGTNGLVICEGEVDTLSAHEALSSLGVHCVGIPCGTKTALSAIKANLDWIDKYDSIYLGFDNDEPGKEATMEVAQFMGDTRVHTLNLPPEVNDINHLLQTNGKAGIIRAFHEAHQWKPRGIIDPKQYLDLVLSSPKRGYDWPWPSLNETTYGIIPGLTLIAAGTGVGKTTFFKQVEAHCIRGGLRIGVIHLEESARMTINSLLSLLKGRDFHTPESTVSLEDRTHAVSELTCSGQLILFDKQVGFDEDTILSTLKFMVKGQGCQVVFLDHLTAVTDQYDSNVNQNTRNLIVKLGKLVNGLEFPLICISHLRKSGGGTKTHEEGGRVHLDDMLGSGAIKQWAEHVFALERDSQAEDVNMRNRPSLRDLKNRPLGEYTGTVLPLQYVSKTFTLEEDGGFHRAPSEDEETPF